MHSNAGDAGVQCGADKSIPRVRSSDNGWDPYFAIAVTTGMAFAKDPAGQADTGVLVHT